MSATQVQAVCDSSTYANFFQWASPISAALAASGWAQSTDTGQIMWSGLSISAVSMSGSNATYTYSGLTGLALAVGRALTITGLGNAGNNGTFVVTALGTGTFTVVNASGVNATGQSGVVTAQAAAPGSGAYFYEIWTPNDGLTAFYVKVEYGNYSGQTNTPSVRVSIGMGTNGTGTVTGNTIGPKTLTATSFTAPSTTAQYECNFSGAAGRFAAMLWRNGTNNCSQFFAIERSVNASGVYTTGTNAYVTLWTAGLASASFPASSYVTQQSLHFTAGAANALGGSNVSMPWLTRCPATAAAQSFAFNGSLPVAFAAPLVGFLDYDCTVAGVCSAGDLTEGITFSASVYGSTRTYMPTKVFPLCNVGPIAPNQNAPAVYYALCMRFD